MENEVMTENEINILDMLFVLRKNIVKIIVVAVVAAVLSLAYTVTMITPTYRSTTQLLIKALSEEAMSIYPDSSARIMLVNNSIEVLHGTEVMQKIVDELSLEMTPEQLKSCVSISSPADTQVLKISVVHTDPEIAKNIASTFSEMIHRILAESVGVSALSIIEDAKTPQSPIAPNPIKNTILGGFMGAFVSAGWFILMRFINNRIYTPEDAEKAVGFPVFSAIPFVVSTQPEEAETAKKKGDK